jgi:hypothetical protein
MVVVAFRAAERGVGADAAHGAGTHRRLCLVHGDAGRGSDAADAGEALDGLGRIRARGG